MNLASGENLNERIFVRFRDEIRGPLSLEEASELVRTRSLSPSHMVSYDGSSWFAASSIWERIKPVLTSAQRNHAPPAPLPLHQPLQKTNQTFHNIGNSAKESSRDALVVELLAVATVALSALFFVFCWVFAYGNAVGISLLYQLQEDRRAETAIALAEADKFVFSIGMSQVLLFVLIAIAFLTWLARVNCTLRDYGIGEMRFGPVGAVVWWFVPFASYWKPFQLVNEVSQCASSASNRNWRNRGTSLLVAAWWGNWIVTAVLLRLSFRLWKRPNSVDDIIGWCSYKYLIIIDFIVLTVLFIALIVRITFDVRRKLRGLSASSDSE